MGRSFFEQAFPTRLHRIETLVDGVTISTCEFYNNSVTLPPCGFPLPNGGIPLARNITIIHSVDGIAPNYDSYFEYFVGLDNIEVQVEQTSIVTATPVPSLTPCGTPECQIIRELENYQVFVGDPADRSLVELQNLQLAVETTAQALHTFALEYDPGDSRIPSEVFVDVLAGERLIEFTLSTRANCETSHANPRTGITATIDCYSGVTAYTFIHELGHVLVRRSGDYSAPPPEGERISYFYLVQYPVPARSSARSLRNPLSGAIVFGEYSHSEAEPTQSPPVPTPEQSNTVNLEDWWRGYNGWGTGADSLPDPTWNDVYQNQRLPAPQVWIGPCADETNPSGSGLPTAFQQNPCHLRNWVVRYIVANYYTDVPAQYAALDDETRNKLGEIEIEEAAADMFLNWVAERTQFSYTEPNTQLTTTGFENLLWLNRTESQSEGTSAVYQGTGHLRYAWMNCALLVVFNEYDFWNVSTTAISLPQYCIDYGLPTP